jgi:ApbE superfamily uncharacterized protein (UPF0280 family)
MNGAQRQPLPGGRWHFQHGPIDCVIGVDGSPDAVVSALESAWQRFQPLLGELAGELPLLRADLGAPAPESVAARGVVAQRMVNACRPYAVEGHFITAMAAVAGSVAQELIAHFDRPGIQRAYVNNGGDIALHLAPGEVFDIGLVVDPSLAATGVDGRFRVTAESGVRGVATSGWRGRSLSLGIADSVTVLAASATQADAAATMIANAVNVDAPAVRRLPANQVRDDSDLGGRLVTVGVGRLSTPQVAQALAAGLAQAEHEFASGRVHAVLLCLQGQTRSCAGPARALHAPHRASPILRSSLPFSSPFGSLLGAPYAPRSAAQRFTFLGA